MILMQPLYNLLCPGSNSSRITTWIPYYNLNWRFIKLILQMWNQVSSISRKFLQRKRREFWRIADRCYEVGKLEKRTWRHRATSGWRRPARIETFQSRPHVAHSNNISKTDPKKAKERKDGSCSNCELQTQDNSATTREKARPTKQLQPPIHSRKHLFETLPRFHGLCKPKWDKEMVVRRRWCDNQHKMVPIYHVEVKKEATMKKCKNLKVSQCLDAAKLNF